MPEEIDTEYTRKPICPHCGDEIEDIDDIFDVNENASLDCPACRKPLRVTRDFDVTYCTEKIDESQEQKP